MVRVGVRGWVMHDALKVLTKIEVPGFVFVVACGMLSWGSPATDNDVIPA